MRACSRLLPSAILSSAVRRCSGEGGCRRDRRGVASMAAALVAAAGSRREIAVMERRGRIRHWSIAFGDDVRPGRRLRQVPCISARLRRRRETWTTYAIASNEITVPGIA